MIEQERWESLISRLLLVCVRIGDEMSAGSNMEASSRIFRALFQKGVDTLHGIQVLYKKSLPIQAQVLVRGFSGMSVEERARDTGLSDLYHVVYRNFSRNVHSTDYMESISVQDIGGWSRWPEYKDLRDHVAMSAAITCVWQMSLMANEAVGCGLREELKEIREMCLGFEHWVGFPTGKEE
jgi:hypothetical protein